MVVRRHFSMMTAVGTFAINALLTVWPMGFFVNVSSAADATAWAFWF
jgi:hypothetical protein